MSDSHAKNFLLKEHQIKPLAEGIGACFATDMITVSGQKVGFMYREGPDNDFDSGWRFLTGDESQDYLDDDRNTSVFDVNVIANYDPDILPHLDAPIGSAFEREGGVGEFEEIELIDEDDEDYEDDEEFEEE